METSRQMLLHDFTLGDLRKCPSTPGSLLDNRPTKKWHPSLAWGSKESIGVTQKSVTVEILTGLEKVYYSNMTQRYLHPPKSTLAWVTVVKFGISAVLCTAPPKSPLPSVSCSCNL